MILSCSVHLSCNIDGVLQNSGKADEYAAAAARRSQKYSD